MTARRRDGQSRPALLAAGFQVIATRGYAAATTAEICRRAGVSSGTFFHYFPTKEDLLLAVLTEQSDPDDQQEPASLDDLIDEVLAEVAEPLLPAFIREVSTLTTVPRVRRALQQADELRDRRLREAVEAERSRGALHSDLSVPDIVLRLRVILDGVESLIATAPESGSMVAGPFVRALIRDAVGAR